MSNEQPQMSPIDTAAVLSRLETENRLLFSLLKPVIRFARRCRIPLDRLVELITLGYFKDLRAGGLTVKESAEVLGKSVRTVTAISQRVKSDFFAPEAEHGLPRRIEYFLAIEPQTMAQLLESLGGEAVDNRSAIEAALASLLRDERIVAETRGGRLVYRANADYVTLTQDNWERRIDALNHLGEATLDTVISRLQENDPDAFARVFTFAATSDALGELREQVYRTLRDGTAHLEGAATDQGVGDQKYHIVFCVSPVVEDNDLQPSGAARRSRRERPTKKR
ncbi:MAG: hypothetical protein KC609_25740 [Myxococcales bacterium]|nr:hypothetical protein [Myxococcales bacterium]